MLRGLVTRYIGYAQEDVTLAVHRGLPSRHVTLVISLEGPMRCDGLEGAGALQSAVGGLHTSPALIRQERVQRGVQLELDPLGARTLLGVTAAELTGRMVDLAEFGGELARLPDRLAEAAGWRERFAILDEVLAARAVEPAEPPPELDRAWRRLTRSGGLLRVGELADEVGWSRRHLGERFRAELGLPPKRAARVLRFERAVRLLRTGHRDLAGIAHAAGYYDQAHFSNEWRALAGCSPRTWMAEELPFLQDESPEAGTESVA